MTVCPPCVTHAPAKEIMIGTEQEPNTVNIKDKIEAIHHDKINSWADG